jgi:FixJ family two-component response regulator
MATMEAVNLREELTEYLKTADERLLNVLKAVVESYRENDIVAYGLEGKPVTRKEYRQELLAAEEEISKGDYLSQEDLEKEIDSW